MIGCTHLAGTSFERSNLNLVQGQAYYVTVQAHNTVGLWNANGVSNEVPEQKLYLPSVGR